MSDEAEKGYYTLERVDCKVVHKIERTAGGNKYLIEYREMNGDTYEKLLYESSIQSRNDEGRRQKILSDMIREKMLVSVAGEEYKPGNEVFWPVWILADVNNFIIEYLQGNK